MQKSENAPIALFVFKRPEHTRLTLESLAQNAEFPASPLFIYCDGARNDAESAQVDETRRIVRGWPHPNKTIIERDRNWGLANSVVAGATELCERFGRVIVVEDDLSVSRFFLEYMNAALDRYADDERIMQISGHSFGRGYSAIAGSSFLPMTTSWGWATWKRAWQHFDAEAKGHGELESNKVLRKKFDLNGAFPYSRMMATLSKNNQLNRSWAIRWYWSAFRRNALVLFPHRTLVLNRGFDGSGTNYDTAMEQVDIDFSFDNRVLEFPPEIAVDDRFFKAVCRVLRGQQSIFAKGIRYLKPRLRSFFRGK